MLPTILGMLQERQVVKGHLALAGGGDFHLQDHFIESVVFELPLGSGVGCLCILSLPQPFVAQFTLLPLVLLATGCFWILVFSSTDIVDAPAPPRVALLKHQHHNRLQVVNPP